jgi:hypothetical protein
MGHLTEKPKANVWCIENGGATFLVCTLEQGSPEGVHAESRLSFLPWHCRLVLIECRSKTS